MLNVGNFIASTYLPPAAPLVAHLYGSWDYIRITNNSNYLLSLNFEGVGVVTMPEMFFEDIPMLRTFTGLITITPSINLTSTSHSSSNLITIMGWERGELQFPQAQPLQTQAVTTTATGKPIFTAYTTFGITSTVQQVLNVFNPAASGTNFIFHAGKVQSNDASVPIGQLRYLAGADNNFAISIPANSHNGQTSQVPVSVSHCTAQDSNISYPVTTVIESINIPGNEAQQDFIGFPDQWVLSPGGNLYILLAGGTLGSFNRLVLKWTEDVIVPPVIISGATAVASSIINDGNPVGTQVIEMTPQGQSSSALVVTNDGQATWKVLQSIYHQVLKIQAAGNPLQLGQAGDITEILGNLIIDGTLTATAAATILQSLTVNAASSFLGTSSFTGLATFIAGLTSAAQISANAPLFSTANGSVSGHADLYCAVWGSGLKIGLVQWLANFQTASAVTLLFPSSINFGFVYTGTISASTVQFNNGGSAAAMRHVLTIGGAGAAGTDESVPNFKGLNLGQFGQSDRFIINTTGGGNINSFSWFIGQ